MASCRNSKGRFVRCGSRKARPTTKKKTRSVSRRQSSKFHVGDKYRLGTERLRFLRVHGEWHVFHSHKDDGPLYLKGRELAKVVPLSARKTKSGARKTKSGARRLTPSQYIAKHTGEALRKAQTAKSLERSAIAYRKYDDALTDLGNRNVSPATHRAIQAKHRQVVSILRKIYSELEGT